MLTLTHTHTFTLMYTCTYSNSDSHIHTHPHTYLYLHILQRLVGGPESSFICFKSHSTTGAEVELHPKVRAPIQSTMLPTSHWASRTPRGTMCLGALIAILVCHQPATDARTMNKLSTFLRFCAIRTGLPACTTSERNTVDSKGRKHFADTALSSQGTVWTCQELSSYHPRKAGQNISTKKSDHSQAPKRKAWVKEAIDVVLEQWSSN